MKTCRSYLMLLIGCIMICNNKEGIGQQRRFEEITLTELTLIPDSLRTPEQKELFLKIHRVLCINTEFRGDSVVFLLDKDGFLSEGLPEAVYLEHVEYLEVFNSVVRNAQPQIRQRLLSTEATFHAARLKFFGFEYSGDIPLLEHTNYAKPGEFPKIGGLKNAAVVPYLKVPAGAKVDTVRFVKE